jgi:F-type H+-transporting ATPase subunit delta
MPAALASRYAGALVDVVTGPKSEIDPAGAVRQLRAFEAVFTGSIELRNALASPAVAPSRKRAVIARLAESLALSRTVRNFLYVLADHRRTHNLAEVVDAFETLIDERLGIVRVDISSARELDERQRGLLNGELARLTGSQVRLRFAVDPALIGGVVARVGSTVYDGSVAGQLEGLERRLGAD